ncbi:spermatogenesis-associated protein 48 [Clupea harengus]|uniref:Spermatogenesis-associated protein 48 n=1 Tax=Clupea harengus TaxID=7950 RepID=A0A6P8G6T8_CLUHA|nr:spermatogenesis-associated protein 48 [Clupea harengus]
MSASMEPHRIAVIMRPNQSQIGLDRWLHKQINLPPERGPEGRYEFESLKEKAFHDFTKFNPLAQPPAANAALAPSRDEVLLIDPCSGQLSAGAEVDLGNKRRRKFIDRAHTPSDLWVPTGSRDRPQTPPHRPASVQCDSAEHRSWNSRTLSDAAVRAGLGGWTSAERVKPAAPNIPCSLKSFSFFLGKDESNSKMYSIISPQSGDEAARHRIYTSMAQRGYEDVAWDTKLPPRLKPPATTLEKTADPVDQRWTLRRYHTRPELWQAVGPHWNRYQLRSRNEVRKPITFTSPCPKSGQIPLYCGSVGSENMDNIDIVGEDFTPLTMLRKIIPPYTPTAYRPTSRGYTGKGHYDTACPSSCCLPAVPCTAPALGSSRWSPPAFGHTGPLSRMVTTTPPQNPFLQPRLPVFPIPT